MEVSAVTSLISQFVRDEINQLGTEAVGPDTALLELGLLDSLSMVNLLSFLNERLGVEVPEDDLLPENFETPRAIARLVCRNAA